MIPQYRVLNYQQKVIVIMLIEVWQINIHNIIIKLKILFGNHNQ